MIARSHRFHGLNALRHVYTHGRTVRAPLVAVKFELNPRRSSYRAAVVVSRKVHKSAVVRNRIRRRIYECLRRSEIMIGQPFDIVVTVFSEEVATMASADLEAMLGELWVKAGIVPGSKGGLPPVTQSSNNDIVEFTNQATPKESS
jgi:ribonuclease P protein component